MSSRINNPGAHDGHELISGALPQPRRGQRCRRGLTVLAMVVALPAIFGTAQASARTQAASGAPCWVDGVPTSNGGSGTMADGTVKTCRDGDWV